MSSKSGKRKSSSGGGSKGPPVPVAPSQPRLCKIAKGGSGYGFNLHSKQGQHGQYIRGIDEGEILFTSYQLLLLFC